MNPLSAVYATATLVRRGWYERHPAARRRLSRPVVSVGNLAVGGSGKTPVIAALATLLHGRGARPAILTRGYGRRRPTSDVVVVSDGERVLEPVERSGDEPLMLARRLTGVPVLVCADRYRAGQVAEERFGASVMLLDDGFQHVQLERNVDLLLMDARDLDERVLPVGRLREPLEVAKLASAVLVPGTADDAARIRTALLVQTIFTVKRAYDSLLRVTPWGAPADVPAGAPVVAVAGIARPDRFFAAVEQRGWPVARRLTFNDHHWYRGGDVERIRREMDAAGAAWAITTEKDAVRLEGVAAALPIAYLPMRVSIEPAESFESWLMTRLRN